MDKNSLELNMLISDQCKDIVDSHEKVAENKLNEVMKHCEIVYNDQFASIDAVNLSKIIMSIVKEG